MNAGAAGTVWAAARVLAVERAPYLASALLALRAVEAAPGSLPAGGFPANEGWRVHVDPEVLALTPPVLLADWLLHQVGHLLRGHAARGRACLGEPSGGDTRTPAQARWNLAADLELAADAPLPGPPLPVPGLPTRGTAEQYLLLLPERTPPGADCGSAADGRRAGSGAGGPGLDAHDARLLVEHTARQVAARARAAGDVPQGWQRWADGVLQPQADWRRELAASVRRQLGAAVGRQDQTYRRRSRRAEACPGVVLPGLQAPRPRVAIVLDTSASMTPHLLAAALAELAGVVRALGAGRDGLRVLCCDSRAGEPARVADPRAVVLAGGGGTDLAAGLVAAAALRPTPELLVVLTDGRTAWPERAPSGLPVVVGVLGDGPAGPTWARDVRVPVGAG